MNVDENARKVNFDKFISTSPLKRSGENMARIHFVQKNIYEQKKRKRIANGGR